MNIRNLLVLIASLMTTLFHARAALAGDGVIELNHAVALAGLPETSDAPGYPITLSGGNSYRLTSNLEPGFQTRAIVLFGSDISLDLGGFVVRGFQACSGSHGDSLFCFNLHGATGIDGFIAGTRSVRVFNGSVEGFTIGIDLLEEAQLSDLRVRHNDTGIRVETGALIHGVNARLNRFDGIRTADFALIHECQAELNGEHGFVVEEGSVITGSSASRNGRTGFETLAGKSVVAGNTSVGNGSNGFRASAGSVVVGNLAQGNDGLGLWLNSQAGYADNVVITGAGGSTISTGTAMGANLCNGSDC